MPEPRPFPVETLPRQTWRAQAVAGFAQVMQRCQDQPAALRHLAALALFAASFLLARHGGAHVEEAPLLALMPGLMVATLLFGAAAYPMALLSVIACRVVLTTEPLAWSGPGTRNAIATVALLLVGIAVVQALIAELRRRPGRFHLAAAQTEERGRLASGSQARRLADAVENAAFGIAIADPVTDRIRFANRAYALLRGVALRELIGKPAIQAYAAAEVPRVPIMMESADRTGHVEFDTEYLRPDGSTVPVRKGITAVRDSAGTIRYRLIYATDASSRRRAEEAGRESEARFRATFEQAAVGIAHLDLAGRILRANDRYCEITGHRREDLTRRHAQDLVLPADRDRGRSQWEALLEGRAERHGVERRQIQAGGSQLWVRATTSLVRDEAGKRAYLMQVLVDISEQKRGESALQHANKMDALGNLAGGIAHDFINMLGVVSGNLELLAAIRPDDAELQSLAQEAIGAVLRGADLTRRLLGFSRRQPLNPRPVDINALLGSVAQLLQRSLRDDIAITLDLAEMAWPVLADPGQIEAAVTNLATNARDAMPSGGRLRIATENQSVSEAEAEASPDALPGDYVVIEVADTGNGIPAEVLPHIFEPFFTTKPPGAGTGLGLAMVFGFVRRSEGHVRVISVPGEGTTFRLFLPRAPGNDRQAAPAATEAAPPRGRETILVAEDNAQLRGIMVQQLGGLGYRVLEAADGPAALRIVESLLGDGRPLDLLLSDVTMPGGMTGFELARAARARLPGLRVLIASANADDLPDEAAPAFPVLHKPFRGLELARAVRAALGG